MKKKLGVAIIGCGMIAKSHAEAVINDGRAELIAAAYGTNLHKGQEFAEKFGIPRIVGDYHELLGDPAIDAVCICSPSSLHAECAVDFASHGVHILCEKPLDVTKEKMTAMIDAAKKNDVVLGCVFPNRTIPTLQKAKAILESNELGAMRIVEFQYRGYRSPVYFTSSKWKGTKQYDGGGALMNQGIHGVDLMLYLTGDVASVCADVDTLGRDIEVEDTASALLRFKNGAKGVLMGTTLSHVPEPSPEGDSLRIECERGTIVYANGKTTLYRNRKEDEFDIEVIPLDEPDANCTNSGSAPENINMEAHQLIVSNFISASFGEEEIMIPADSARRAVDLVLTIYESSKEGKWLPVHYE
ncbi:MAG: Gfo/Idh/MocA family oxidoreductase [Ruminococcaceae bacterium]|nr:Gfo/Idh/MocA family oxidoreductase [Oscillospiraceae bacterium]